MRRLGTGSGGTGSSTGTGSSGTDYEVANVPGAGIYRYSEATGAWTQISTATTATSLGVDAQGDLIAELRTLPECKKTASRNRSRFSG